MLTLLLPGLDGTGQMFAALVAELPKTIEPRVIAYPPDRALGYDALQGWLTPQLPTDQPFAIVAESFSGPLGMRIAATRPPNLKALVLVATFHRKPAPSLLAALKPFARSALFGFGMPAFAIRKLLAGADASEELIAAFQASLMSVRPGVIATRVRATLDIDASDALTKCEVPALYLAANHDGLLRPGIPDELRALQPKLEVQTFDAPHLILQRLPREAAAAITEFVDRALVHHQPPAHE